MLLPSLFQEVSLGMRAEPWSCLGLAELKLSVLEHSFPPPKVSLEPRKQTAAETAWAREPEIYSYKNMGGAVSSHLMHYNTQACLAYRIIKDRARNKIRDSF